MKILVLSDSHSALSFMRSIIHAVKPDAVIHLGDHYDDGQAMAEENPHIRFHLVPGNCDTYRCPMNTPLILNYDIGGVRFYMTHGHRHFVKQGIGNLLSAARQGSAKAVLYGHTHQKYCSQEPDGLWVLNPGSCGSMGGSAGLITVLDGAITQCEILTAADLEEML